MWIGKGNWCLDIDDIHQATMLDGYLADGWLKCEVPKPTDNKEYRCVELTNSPGWGEWVLNDAPFNLLVSQTLDQIQTEKNKIRDSGFLVEGLLFDSDEAARTAYLELSNEFALDPSYETPWKASKGIWVTMNQEQYNKIRTAGKLHIANCFAWQAGKEAELKNCTTVEEIKALNISYGE